MIPSLNKFWTIVVTPHSLLNDPPSQLTDINSLSASWNRTWFFIKFHLVEPFLDSFQWLYALQELLPGTETLHRSSPCCQHLFSLLIGTEQRSRHSANVPWSISSWLDIGHWTIRHSLDQLLVKKWSALVVYSGPTKAGTNSLNGMNPLIFVGFKTWLIFNGDAGRWKVNCSGLLCQGRFSHNHPFKHPQGFLGPVDRHK